MSKKEKTRKTSADYRYFQFRSDLPLTNLEGKALLENLSPIFTRIVSDTKYPNRWLTEEGVKEISKRLIELSKHKLHFKEGFEKW